MSKDATENRLEECPDVFVDIFNNLILEGHGTLKEEDLIAMPTRAYRRKMDGELQSGMRDVRKMACGSSRFRLICALENQTGVDHTMPERIMGYEYAGYEEQVKILMEENEKRRKSAGSKRIFKKQKLAPIVTGVLYFGEKSWTYPRTLHEMIQFPEGMEDILKKYVADYPVNIVQVAHLTKEQRERLTSDFRIVAEYLACKNDREKWTAFLENTKEINHVEELLDVIWELSHDENYKILKENIKNKNDRKEKWSMCEIAQELERIGREEGIKEGIKEGIQTGILAMIRDNLEMGKEKEHILEKLMKYFSITLESATNYYESVVAQ